MFNIGPQELLLILLVALVIVGPKRLPEISRTIGRGLREFRKAQDEVTRTIRLGLDEIEPSAPRGADAATLAGADADGQRSEATTSADAEASSSAPSDGDVADVARTLGRGLAEIRRTRREIQRTFRIDLTDPDRSAPSPARPATPTPSSSTPAASQGPRPSEAHVEPSDQPVEGSTEPSVTPGPDEPPSAAGTG